MSEFYSVFSNYEIEDVYNFIKTEKLFEQKKLIRRKFFLLCKKRIFM